MLLTLGFLGLLGALVAAHGAPATSYEVDIYAATPVLFWAGVGLAYLVFLLTAFTVHRRKTVTVALLLGGAATTAIAALPLIRGYHYYGHSDPMTHLGWVRSLEAGSLNTLEFVYPGTHSLSLVVHQTTGLDVPFSMMLVVLGFVVTFLLFVPLTVYALTGDVRATAIAGFSAFLLLPINNIATGLPYFPFLLATFFFTMILYLFVKHVTVPTVEGVGVLDRSRYLQTSAVFPVASAAVLFFHPQATMDVLAVLGAMVVAQLAVRRWRPDHPLADTRILLGQVVFLGIIFLVWSSQQGAAVKTVDQVYTSLEQAIFGEEGGEFAHTAASRQASARQIGVTVLELFVKLFLVSAIYGLLALVATVVSASERFAPLRDRHVSNVVVLVVIGGIALTVVSALHTFGGISGYLYRHLGFGMILVTVLGSVGLAMLDRTSLGGLEGTRWSPATGLGRALMIALVAGMLVMSLLTVFPSPYMYNPGGHVAEDQVDGYEAALLSKPSVEWDSSEAVWYAGIRRGPNRYQEARGVQNPRDRRIIFSGPVPNEELFDLPAYYRTHNETITRRDHYLPVMDYDYQREIVAYKELRYSRQGLAAVASQPAVHRIQDNDAVTVYYVDLDLYTDSATSVE